MLIPTTPWNDRTLIRQLLLFVSLLLLAGPVRSQTFADWVSDNGTTVTGTVGGTSITFSRDANGSLGALVYNGTSTFTNTLSSPATPFTPTLGSSDSIEFHGKKSPAPVPTYTLTFGTSVVDPILLIQSNASTLTFSATPTFISGTTTPLFNVSGNQVSGTDFNGAYTDANGTVKFTGTFTSLSFTAVYAGTGVQDGINLQVGITAIPEPSAYAAIAGLAMLGLAVYRRRRA